MVVPVGRYPGRIVLFINGPVVAVYRTAVQLVVPLGTLAYHPF